MTPCHREPCKAQGPPSERVSAREPRLPKPSAPGVRAVRRGAASRVGASSAARDLVQDPWDHHLTHRTPKPPLPQHPTNSGRSRAWLW